MDHCGACGQEYREPVYLTPCTEALKAFVFRSARNALDVSYGKNIDATYLPPGFAAPDIIQPGTQRPQKVPTNFLFLLRFHLQQRKTMIISRRKT